MEVQTFSILSCFLCMGVESNQWSQQAMHQSFNQLLSLSPIPFRFSIWPLITLLAIGLQQRVTTSRNKTTPKLKVIELILKSLFDTDYTDFLEHLDMSVLQVRYFVIQLAIKSGLTITTLYKFHTPTNILFIKLYKVLKFTLKVTSTCSYMFRSLSKAIVREPSLEPS